ncbi:hypothetical protein OROMI_031270 [Orobanche minor]
MEKINRKKPLVFLDVSIDGGLAERMIFELFTDVAPKTAENFRALCTGEKGVSTKTAKPLHYKGTFFHLIVKGHVAQAGDFLRQGGKFGESTYGGNFPGCDESPKLKHDGPGLLTMAIDDRDERGSLFYVTFKADHRLDRKCVVFGKLVNGLEVLKEVENAGDEEGTPSVTVKIINSGELHDDKKKGNRSKMGKNTIQGINADKRKGKHKKSSKKRRKRRKVYTSESDSSTDTDTESSESDSDSDSYATSLSDTSSSSDDRRRKRKRSKRDRNKHGKRKEKRREKRRKRRYRKMKRKSKRNNSESASESESSSEDNLVIYGKYDSSGNQSPCVQEREISTVNHKKGAAADTSESEEGEFPKENGNHKSNGIGPLMESYQNPDREPDPVDNRPSKSRSQELTPRRTMSKSMSISPRKNAHRIPSVSGSPHQIFNKSRSNSPVRSESSRSPIRSPPRIKKGISGSMSPPVRSPSHRSRSRSRTVSPPRRRVAQSPPRTSSRRSSHRSLSRSPKRSSHRSRSRGSGRAPRRRSPTPTHSPVRAPDRITRRSYSKSPVGAGRRARSPISDRGRSSSRSRSVDHGSPKRIRRGRGFSDRYSYVRRYRSRSPDRSPIRSYRYAGRSYRDGYRRSPRRYRSPPRGRTPPRYRGRRSRSRSPSVSRRRNSPSRSPVRSKSPVERYRGGPARGEKPKSPSRSISKSRSSPDSRSPRRADKLRSLSGSPTRRTGLVSYEVGDGSPDSDRE